MECLMKGVKWNKFVCLMCKKSYNFKEKGIEIFLKDFIWWNLKDILGRLIVNLCIVCWRLESVWFMCIVCKSNLCKVCYKVWKFLECKIYLFKEV